MESEAKEAMRKMNDDPGYQAAFEHSFNHVRCCPAYAALMDEYVQATQKLVDHLEICKIGKV